MPPGRLNLAIGSGLCTVLLVCLALGQSRSPHDDIGTSLPRTNLSANGAVDRSGLPRPALGFANAHVASNPLAPDTRTVGEATCVACHKLEADHFTHTLHSWDCTPLIERIPPFPCVKPAMARDLSMPPSRKSKGSLRCDGRCFAAVGGRMRV
jgi:hypothetical protein